MHVFFNEEDSSPAITSRLVAAVSCSAPPPSVQDETNSTHQVTKDLSSGEWGESRRNKGKTRRSSMDRVDESHLSDSFVQSCKQAQAIGLWTTTGSVPNCHASCSCTDVHALGATTVAASGTLEWQPPWLRRTAPGPRLAPRRLRLYG